MKIAFTTVSLLRLAFPFLDIVKENDNDIEFHAVFQRLSEEEIPDLPPGGGLYSKYVKTCQGILFLDQLSIPLNSTHVNIMIFFRKLCIEEVYNALCPGKTDTSVSFDKHDLFDRIQ